MSSRDVPVARSLLVTIIMFTPACWPHGSRCSQRAHSSLHSMSTALSTGLYTRWHIVSITPCTRAVSGVGTLSAAGTLGDVWLEVAHCHTRWPCSLVKQSIACCRGSTVMQNEHAMTVVRDWGRSFCTCVISISFSITCRLRYALIMVSIVSG